MGGDGCGGSSLNGKLKKNSRVGHIWQKYGKLLFWFSFSVWFLWHVTMFYAAYTEPVQVTVKPLGYDIWNTDGSSQAFSYFRIKNVSSLSKWVKFRLYLLDTTGERWEYEIKVIKNWGNEPANAEIREDFSITVHGKQEIGLYIEAYRNGNNLQGSIFPYHTEQEVELLVYED